MEKFKFIKTKSYYEYMRNEKTLTADDLDSLMSMIHEFEDIREEEKEVLRMGDIHEIRDFYSKVEDMNLLEAEYEVLVSRYHDLQGTA